MAKKELTVELNVDATQANKALNQFGGTLEDVYGEGVQPLNFAIGELEDRLYEMAAAGQSGTKEFQDMAAEVGRMKKVIIDTDLLVDGMSQNLAQNLSGATMGLASGFELAQGSMAAFGVESEKVEETLLKVQSAMAISQGLQGIKESIGSFRGLGAAMAKTAVGQTALTVATKIGTAAQWALNVAMNANPVFLLITGITALAAAIVYFASQTEHAEEMQAKLNETTQKYNEILNRTRANLEKAHEQRMRQLEVEGASEEEIHKQRLKNLKEQEILRQNEMKSLKAQNDLRRNIYNQALKEGNEDVANAMKEEIQSSKERYEELARQNGDYNLAVQEENKRFREAEEQARKEQLAKYKSYLEARLAAKRDIQDRELSLLDDGLEKERRSLELWREREIESVKADSTLKGEERQKKLALIEEQTQQKLLDIQLKYASPEAQLPIKDAERENQAEIVDINLEAMQKVIDGRQEWRQKDLENEQALQDAKFELAGASLSAISDIVSAFAGENERAQKRAFQIQKAISIGQAVMDTYKGANAIFASAAANPASVLFPAQPFIAAGAAIVTGLANVATIARTQFQGGGAAGGGGGASTPPSLTGGGSPSFNVVGNTGTNQLAETLGNQPPTKAYVVGADVTTQQSLDRNKIEQSTL